MTMTVIDIKSALQQNFGLDSSFAKVLVVGAGETGLSVARFLHAQSIQFAVIDSRRKPPLLEKLFEMLPDTPVFVGGFDDDAFKVATHLVVSPGVSLREAVIMKARANGAAVISDIDLFAVCAIAPVVAITGSNGKSTVTTMVGEMAKAAGKKVAVGGNLGTPALDLLQPDCELYVLELSSFQLERTALLNAAAATVLNISADHFDRHSDINEYAEEKQRIFRGNGVMVLNLDDPIVKGMSLPERKVLTFAVNSMADFHLQYENDAEYLMDGARPLMRLDELPLEGRHNAANALAALALGQAIGLDESAMVRVLQHFKGLEHRMQRVAVRGGINWVNDSKATNIGACIAALQGYTDRVILIAGGDAKGADMNELVPVLKAKAKAVILMGKDAASMNQAIDGCVDTCLADNMIQAVKMAADLAKQGDTVLLSPACASLDQYSSYKERGKKFVAAVMGLPHG